MKVVILFFFRFFKEFFGNCEVIILCKLEMMKLIVEENSKRLCIFKDELEKFEVIRKEVICRNCKMIIIFEFVFI